MTEQNHQLASAKPRRPILTLKTPRSSAPQDLEPISSTAPPSYEPETKSPDKKHQIAPEQFHKAMKAITSVVKQIGNDATWRNQELWEAYLIAKSASNRQQRLAAKIVSMAAIRRLVSEGTDPDVAETARTASYAAALTALVDAR